jgi:cystathionine beta-lyase/cystathionine gamma-synthase
MSTTFVRDAENALVRPDNSYGRDQNEGVRLAEDVIAALEGAEDVLLFPSGMAAIAAIFQALPTGITGFGAIRHLLGNDEIHRRSCGAPWNGCRFY